MKRSPTTAVWLSLIPGAGHIYVGFVAKGILLILLLGSTIQMVSHGADGFGIVIPFIWLYAMIDAHRSAVEYNRNVSEGGAPPSYKKFNVASWWGYVLIVLGLLFAAENFDLIDFEWIWRLWPLVLIALGVYLLKRPVTASAEPPGSVPPVPPASAAIDAPLEPSPVEEENG
jgi:TM2 domain-containing membrane protein YozV